MIFLYVIFLAILNIIYQAGFFAASIFLKLTEQHYHFGKGDPWLKFNVRGVTFSIATYFPFPGLLRIYTIVNGEKQAMKYPWEFHHASIVRRIAATLSGVATLLFTSFFLFTVWLYTWEDFEITKEEVNRLGIYPSEWAEQLGFEKGDKIIAINGKDYQYYSDIIKPQTILADSPSYTILRKGKEIRIALSGGLDDMMENGRPFLLLMAPFEVTGIRSNSPGELAGIQLGDRITKINGEAIVKHLEVPKALRADDDGKVMLEIERKSGDTLQTITKIIQLSDDRMLGISFTELIQYTAIQNTLLESIWNAPGKAFQSVILELRAFARIVTGIMLPAQSLSGPIGIFKPNGMYIFTAGLGKIAMIAVFWNLFPFPGAAFWEIIPLVYEGTTGKKYRRTWYDKTQRISSIVAKVLLALVIVLIFSIDILRNL